MPNTSEITKDKDGFHYKYPNRSCSKCLKYPCIPDMNKLKSNFGAYGCRNYDDENIFNVCKK